MGVLTTFRANTLMQTSQGYVFGQVTEDVLRARIRFEIKPLAEARSPYLFRDSRTVITGSEQQRSSQLV